MTTNPEWFRQMEAGEARRQERLDEIRANMKERDAARQKEATLKYITIDDEETLAYITLIMDGPLFVGLYGIPDHGGYYWLASNWSECGYCESEDEAKAELRRSWKGDAA